MQFYRITRRKKRFKRFYCYSVISTVKNKKYSKCTTKKKAVRQQRLLYAIRFNKKFQKR